MAHCGSLQGRRLSNDIHDIRGTTIRGSDGEKLGQVEDVIFDHDTMEIRYLVVDGSPWLESGTYLIPADRVFTDEDDEHGLATTASANQIQSSPQYRKKSPVSPDAREKDEWENDAWQKYEQEFKKYWDEEPVMHIKGSERIITPPEESVPDRPSSTHQGNRRSGDGEINAARLFPERISEVFSDPEPSGGKVTLRPKSVSRAEDVSRGVTLVKPRWWESFQDYLRVNKNDIRDKCSRCSSEAA
jgi:sporulation protein YlmC with PRC-barrel domain